VYLFECEVTFEAGAATVWRIWTDVARWPEWDASKEIAQMDGEFQAGSSGWVKKHNALGGTFAITSVEPGRRWISESPLPLGRVIFDHIVEPLPGGQVRVVKGVQVEGGSAGLFRVLAAPRMRRDIEATLAALRERAQAEQARAVAQARAEAEQAQAAGQPEAQQAQAEQAARERAQVQGPGQAGPPRRTPHVA
jgi:uncharacterized protein YndB with AHSA1/START domain